MNKFFVYVINKGFDVDYRMEIAVWDEIMPLSTVWQDENSPEGMVEKIFFSSACGNLKSIIYSFSIMSLLPLGLGTTLQSAACERKIWYDDD